MKRNFASFSSWRTEWLYHQQAFSPWIMHRIIYKVTRGRFSLQRHLFLPRILMMQRLRLISFSYFFSSPHSTSTTVEIFFVTRDNIIICEYVYWGYIILSLKRNCFLCLVIICLHKILQRILRFVEVKKLMFILRCFSFSFI
jgi:hypothetical protein